MSNKELNFSKIMKIIDVQTNKHRFSYEVGPSFYNDMYNLNFDREEWEKWYFEDIDFSGYDLSGIVLDDKELFLIDFTDANLSNSIWKGTSAPDAYFHNTNFSNSILDCPYFEEISMTNSNFSNVKINDMVADFSDMSNSNFSNAEIIDSDMNGIILDNSDLSNVKISYTNMLWAHLRGANLRNAKINDVNMKESNLMYADLTNADFTGAYLLDSDFQYAKVNGIKGQIVYNRIEGDYYASYWPEYSLYLTFNDFLGTIDMLDEYLEKTYPGQIVKQNEIKQFIDEMMHSDKYLVSVGEGVKEYYRKCRQ